MNSVLFLDIDGVLNSRSWFQKRHDMRIAGETMDREESEIDPDAMSLLNRVLSESGCDVVISSTWRRFKTQGQLQRLFVARGMDEENCDRFVGITPFINGPRGNEIQEWLIQNPEYSRFAIVDDDADMEHLMPYLVQCRNQSGLTEQLAAELIERLK